jgi:hypothetical protein
MHRFTIQLDAATYESIKAEAEATNRYMGAIIRDRLRGSGMLEQIRQIIREELDK